MTAGNHRRGLAASLIFLLLIAGCSAEPHAADFELDLANFDVGVRESIEAALERAAAEPESAEAQGALGNQLHAYGIVGEAAKAYARAVSLQPDLFRWSYYEGKALYAAGFIPEAAIALERANGIRADYAPSFVMLGEIRLEEGSTADARRQFQRAIEIDSESTPAQYGLGKALQAQGDQIAASEAFLKAVRLSPRFWAGHYALGLAYRNLGRPELAQKHLALSADRADIALARDPLMAQVHRLDVSPATTSKRAIQREASGDVDGALEMYLEVVEAAPDFIPARFNLIRIYSDRGEFGEAERHYREAIAISPNAQQVRYNWARALIAQGRLEDARVELERVLEINPNFADALVLLGSLLFDRGAVDLAVERFERALRAQPKHPQANLMLAAYRARAGDLAGAERHAQSLLEANSESLPILIYRLGITYRELGLEAEAKRYLLEARSRAVLAGRTRLVAEIDQQMSTGE